MKNLIRAEWFKLSKSSSFRLLLSCSVFAGILLAVICFVGGTKAPGYRALDAYLATILFHMIFTYAFAAVFICSEIRGHTFGASLLCGFPRISVFFSKAAVFFVGVLLLTLVPTAVCTIAITLANGFGMASFMEACTYILPRLFYAITGFAALSSAALLISLVVKNKTATAAIGMGGTYFFMVIEANTRELPVYKYYKYVYIHQIEQLRFSAEYLADKTYLAVTLITAMLAMALAAFIFEKAEL